MPLLCPVRVKKKSRKGAPLPRPKGRITGSDSVDTLVQVQVAKETGFHPQMVVIQDFVPCVDDELPVQRGQQVAMLYQENDWLYVAAADGSQGFVPYTYCLPLQKSVDDFHTKSTGLPVPDSHPAQEINGGYEPDSPRITTAMSDYRGTTDGVHRAEQGDHVARRLHPAVTTSLESPREKTTRAPGLNSRQTVNGTNPNVNGSTSRASGTIEEGRRRSPSFSRRGGQEKAGRSDVERGSRVGDTRGRQSRRELSIRSGHQERRWGSLPRGTGSGHPERIAHHTRSRPHSLDRQGAATTTDVSFGNKSQLDSAGYRTINKTPHHIESDRSGYPCKDSRHFTGESSHANLTLSSNTNDTFTNGSWSRRQGRSRDSLRVALQGGATSHRSNTTTKGCIVSMTNGNSGQDVSPVSHQQKPFRKTPQGKAIVLFAFDAVQENDLTIRRGEFVTILNSDDPDWFWVALSDRREGFVPSNYVGEAHSDCSDTDSAQPLLRSSGRRSNSYDRSHRITAQPRSTTNNGPKRRVDQQQSSASGPHSQTRLASHVSPAHQPKEPVADCRKPTERTPSLTKLICTYQYKSRGPDDLTVYPGEALYVDVSRQPLDAWLWVYSPKLHRCGFVSKSCVEKPAEYAPAHTTQFRGHGQAAGHARGISQKAWTSPFDPYVSP